MRAMNLLKVATTWLAVGVSGTGETTLKRCDLSKAALRCKRSRSREGAPISIEDCGAEANWNEVESARRNGRALVGAMAAARPGDEVVVPHGRRYFVVPECEMASLSANVTLSVEGQLAAHDDVAAWPRNAHRYLSLLTFRHVRGLRIRGPGSVNGQGHVWWWEFAVGGLGGAKRPNLLDVDAAEDLIVEDLAFLDGPRFHIHVGPSRIRRARISRVVVVADWRRQRRYARRAPTGSSFLGTVGAWFRSLWLNPIPMFPFNTDGIDVAGTDIVVEDCVVANWDDTVAVKPSRRGDDDDGSVESRNTGICTRRVEVRNLTTLFGGGLSVGSVDASFDHSCVKETTFRDVAMYRPYKGAYVKTGLSAECTRGDPTKTPQTQSRCSGEIEGILYERVRMIGDRTPDWWPKFEKDQRNRGGAPARVERRDPPPPSRLVKLAQRLLRSLSSRKKNPHSPSWACQSSWWLTKSLCFAWPLYIGPQQQLEPHDPKSPGIWAKPVSAVKIANVTVRDFAATGGDWPEAAAAIRCHPRNPCVGLVLDNVVIDGTFGGRRSWICDRTAAAYGVETNVAPRPGHCLAPGNSIDTDATSESTPTGQNKLTALLVYLACLLVFLLLNFLACFCCVLGCRSCRQRTTKRTVHPADVSPPTPQASLARRFRRLLRSLAAARPLANPFPASLSSSASSSSSSSKNQQKKNSVVEFEVLVPLTTHAPSYGTDHVV